MFVVRREAHNPILTPQHDRPWEAVATFNPSAVRLPTPARPAGEGQSGATEGVCLFYRAIGNPDALQTPHAGLSSIGTAFSLDGVHFSSRQQVIAAQEPWDQFGCEDPRVTFFEGRWYCFYTALGGLPFGPDNIKVGLAVGDSPTRFTERHLITPFNAKAATLFPERINGEVVLLLTAHTDWTESHPHPTIALARAKAVEDFYDPAYWEAWHADLALHALPELRRADSDHVEVGAAPLLTPQGWLLVYAYIEDYYDEHARTFSLEAAILERDDPQNLIARTESILVPEETYETYGMVPGVVFPSGATLRSSTSFDSAQDKSLGASDQILEIWYGATDTVCAKANVRLSDLLRALDPARPVRTFKRHTANPILVPQGSGFESKAVFNAAAFELDGTVQILYRAMDEANTSTIGLAVSRDGVTVDERLPEPIYTPRADFEQKKGGADRNSGCEDPRVSVIANRLYMTYTAYDGIPRGALTSISLEDFHARRWSAWTPPVLITPDNVDDKDIALVAGSEPGEYLLYHRVQNQICVDVVRDLSFRERINRCIELMGPRRGMWDYSKIGIAAPPVRVPEGRLLIYHGVSRHATYRLGAALLDESGMSVLARTADPVFEPVEQYEKEGQTRNVVFSCGAVTRGDDVFLYYGAADKVVGVAIASLAQLRAALT